MSKNDSFGINGRFLTQPMTGVQRYAMNVTRVISDTLAAHGNTAPLLVPKNALDPKLNGTPSHVIGRTGGHIWEQVTLSQAWPNKLLNLCNTAPALKTNQVVCIHDVNVYLAPGSYSAQFRALYKAIQPTIARRAAQIATVSEFSARQIAQHFSLNVSDILVLPNGHEHVFSWDSSRAIRAPAALRSDMGGAERPFILALGSQARHKNLDLLLNLALSLSEIGVDLVIVGGKAGIFKNGQARTNPNVHYIGFVTDDDLAYLMDRALCLAFPSLTEGFGLPVLEAMALGCPVIATNRASLPEICGHAALMADPEQPQQWLAHVRELLRSDELRKDLIGRGQRRAKLFSWDTTAQGYLDIMGYSTLQNIKRTLKTPAVPRIAVVIATLGRPEIVAQTLRRVLDHQSHKPDAIIISCVRPEDAGDAAAWLDVTVIVGQPGLATQRNTALAAVPADIEIVAFFDDDFVPEADWIYEATRLFRDEVDIVGFTGDVIADGIKGPGMSFDTVDRLLSGSGSIKSASLIEPFSPYGCNMAFRRSAIGDLRFDERLVLYGWLEDRDFGAALAAKGGRMVKCMAARGIHMGVKGGRIAGTRLGYSQIVNPIYMLRKGTMSYKQVLDHLLRNIASNLVRSLVPEPFIDRRGRLRGNVWGIADVLLGRIAPERALQIKDMSKKSRNRSSLKV